MGIEAEPSVLIVGEFSDGALALYYERAFAGRNWRTVQYDTWHGYARTPILLRSRFARRALRPFLWRLMAHEVVAAAQREKPDLVVVVKGAFLGVEAVRSLRRMTGVPVVNIYPDSPYECWALRPDMPSVLAEYDRTYIWGRFLLSRLQDDGVRSLCYLPFAHDPSDYAPGLSGPVPGCGRHHEVVFIGQRYPKRENWLESLVGLNVGVWGTGWSGSSLARLPGICIHREDIRGESAGVVYSRARVAINVLHPSNVPAHNMRTFEIPPCQTVMVTEATEEIAGFFPPGNACLDAATPLDLRRQVDRALADPSLAEAVAESGREMGRGHTYAARVETIIQDLGLPAAHRIASPTVS